MRSPTVTAVVLMLCLACSGAATAQVVSLSTGTAGSVYASTGIYFDLTASKSLVLRGIDVETNPAQPFALATVDAELFTVRGGGGFAGHENMPGDWELLGAVGGLTAGPDGTFFSLGLQLDLLMLAGETRGFYLVRTDYDRFQGTVVPSGTTVAANADLTLTSGPSEDFYFARNSIGGWPDVAPACQIHYELHPSNAVDLTVATLVVPVQPTACAALGAAETITVEIRNMGSSTIPAGTQLSHGVVIDGGTPITLSETLTQSIAPLGTHAYSFPIPFDLSAIGPRQIDLSVGVSGDGYAANDSLSVTLWSGGVGRVTSFPWLEDFESVSLGTRLGLPLGWEQDFNDASGIASNWWMTRDYGNIAAINGDHTTGVLGVGAYALLNTLGEYFQVNLLSPCLDLTGLANPRLGFWRSRPPGTLGAEVFVDVIEYPGGIIHLDPDGASGTTGGVWMNETIDLSAFAGKVIQIRFRGDTADFANNDNLGLDDIQVIDALPTKGQNEQPGLRSSASPVMP